MPGDTNRRKTLFLIQVERKCHFKVGLAIKIASFTAVSWEFEARNMAWRNQFSWIRFKKKITNSEINVLLLTEN